MIKISYPPYQPKIKRLNSKELIFDELRKKWVQLTPEEWVRQNFLQYLVQVKQYPPSLIAIEKEIWLNDVKKRFDIVVYKNDVPWMVVECKEMEVVLDSKVLDQALRYNMVLQVGVIVITNGSYCYGVDVANGSSVVLDDLPSFN